MPPSSAPTMNGNRATFLKTRNPPIVANPGEDRFAVHRGREEILLDRAAQKLQGSLPIAAEGHLSGPVVFRLRIPDPEQVVHHGREVGVLLGDRPALEAKPENP